MLNSQPVIFVAVSMAYCLPVWDSKWCPGCSSCSRTCYACAAPPRSVRRRDEDGRVRFQADFPALDALCPPVYKSAVLACIHKDPRLRPEASLLLQHLQVRDQASRTAHRLLNSMYYVAAWRHA